MVTLGQFMDLFIFKAKLNRASQGPIFDAAMVTAVDIGRYWQMFGGGGFGRRLDDIEKLTYFS